MYDTYLAAATKWRRDLSQNHAIRFREELHGYPLLNRRGLYHKTKRNLTVPEASAVYHAALSTLAWLPQSSIGTAYATGTSNLMGHEGIDACLFGLFQRIRNYCAYNHVNGMMFFDEGHPSYIRLYRMAQVYLPTGSKFGGWEHGKLTKNMPLSMFPKDANVKISDLSYFVQIADLTAYAARLKIVFEQGNLSAKRQGRGHHTIYNSIPRAQLYTLATMKRNDAIVPI